MRGGTTGTEVRGEVADDEVSDGGGGGARDIWGKGARMAFSTPSLTAAERMLANCTTRSEASVNRGGLAAMWDPVDWEWVRRLGWSLQNLSLRPKWLSGQRL